jgi:predicted PurR-regulated permease PerM
MPAGPTPGRGTPAVVRAAAVAVIAFVAVLTLHAGARIILPVVEALVVWFVLNAVADGVARVPFVGRRLPRGLALVLAAASAFVVGFLVVENSLKTVTDLGPRALSFGHALDPFLARAADLLGFEREALAGTFAAGFGLDAALRQVIAATVSTISHFSIVAIYVAFLLVDQQFFDAKLRRIVPDPERQARVRAVLGRIVGAIHAYLRVMAFVSLLTASLSWLVLVAVGVEYAGFLATTIFFLNFIPTIGSILGTVLPVAFALLQFQTLGPPVLVLAGVGLVQFAIGNILLPRLSSGTLNISLFVTLFSLFAWGAVWGVTGMFVAMPLTAILIIAFSYFPATRPFAVALSRTGEIEDTR